MSLQIETLFNVEGKIVVITGGGTGIGLMMARALENNGAIVYILGRRLQVLESAAKEHSKHGNLIPLQCDVTSRDNLLSVVETIKKQHGYINVLINNSGVMYNGAKASEAGDDIKAFQDKLWDAGTPEEFTKTFEVNVTSVYYTSVAFLELLDEGNKRRQSPDDPTSQIITTSSIGGFRRDDQTFSLSYSSSKAAVTHLVKTLANIFRSFKIRCNVIAPGLYPSEMSQGLVNQSGTFPASEIPIGRIGNAQDMGGLVLFLVSKAGGYVSGGVHVTDGGRLGLFASTF
ncbi:NAD P-binding protein [Pyrrhoderma noxium]|uniref:NAD P-binding protein n=1 Tax=Pyrrhoderma noxium TaxID=2282107 RepID=A0A286UHC7_9AGAM|nr:NAD P-binding protein [Pyrrhoderma noxium]